MAAGSDHQRGHRRSSLSRLWVVAAIAAAIGVVAGPVAAQTTSTSTSTTSTTPTTSTTAPASTTTTTPTAPTPTASTTTTAPVPPPAPAPALAPLPLDLQATRNVPFAAVIGGFTDPDLGAVRDEGAFVRRAFRDLLRRPADGAAELRWTFALQQRVPRSRLATTLTGSGEGRRVLVNRLYRQVLDRGASSSDAGYWSGVLSRGTPTEAVRAALYGSQEFYAGAGGTPDRFVTALFRHALGRRPDRGARQYFVGLLRGGTRRENVAGIVVTSLEAQRRVVADNYQRLLRRTPSRPDADFWAFQLVGGLGEVRLTQALVSSLEYFRRLPSDYAATITWGGGRRSDAKLRVAGTNRVDVFVGRLFRSNGRVSAHIVVTKTGGPTTTIDSSVRVVGPQNERFVRDLYSDLLGRSSDSAGRRNWTRFLVVGGQRSRQAVARAFINAAEALRRLVRTAFRDYLDRRPNRTEADFWTFLLATGGPLEAMRSGVLGSEEYWARAGRDVDAFIDALYRDVFDRAADGEGRAHVRDLLNAGRSRSFVAAELLASDEGRARVIVRRYRLLLDRSPGNADMQFWLRAMRGGLSEQGLIASLAASAEYFGRSPRAG